ncbi:MAG TPA: hypothetical protein ACFCUY_02650 [Xenococcaceae cyanobacterium]
MFVAIYYLLLEISGILRKIVSSIFINIEYIYARIFNDYRDSEIRKQYKYNRNIVFKLKVEEYLEDNPDERIRKKLEAHDKDKNDLFLRKRNLMLISILLTINFFLYQNLFEQFAKLYWLFIIITTVYAGILPYDNLTFMYIRNNKIRK